MEDIKETKEWCIWIETGSKIISFNQIPNSRKKVFETEKEMIDFGARLVFKGYKIG